ncbi:general secretion pathway protein GspE [Aggregicoccus sp. 17bor-14]|uniref:GspE/PulE/PilB domain-containing protein n=1 Tax=Myxococcaceae TaxID=31 RepID=UPI00129C2D99|nr:MULTISPECIES: general secretion pathway protein GspE [Myxococcaceae]MBF5045432.1 general secretion pathway protein GspE [Simulacricoccus sp. 17bor-14]MRI91173.1 general secretion pathway protein GspE [Aggregicoccus sp. 17bor-14]
MKRRLGDILVAQGALDPLQLQAALAYQRTWGVPLGQVVVDQRFCSAGQVLQALATQTGLPAVDLDAQPLDPALGRLVPLKVAEAHRVVPLRVEGPRDTVLVVAIAAPATLTSLDAVKSVSGKGRVTPHLATDAAIQRAIQRIFHPEEAAPASAVPMTPISLPEAEADMPFEVESWAATVNTPVHGMDVRALRQPGTPGGPPAARPSGVTPTPFRPPAPAPAAPRPAPGATPLPFRPEPAAHRPAPGATPLPFRPEQGTAVRPPAGATPPPLPSARRPTGSFPAVTSAGAAPAHEGASANRASAAPPSAAASRAPLAHEPPASAAAPPAPAARPSGVHAAVPSVAPTGVRVLFYGWGTEATAGLLRALAAEGLPMQVASTADVLAADARTVVIAPLPAMEGVGQRVRAQLIVAGKAPEVDLVRAQALGAKGFLAAPLDADLLLRAVRRLRKALEEEAAKG